MGRREPRAESTTGRYDTGDRADAPAPRRGAPAPTNAAAGAPAPLIAAPTLPKGGGAIQGIGETFQANPVTGTASLVVPIPVTPGRGGFGPQLSLSYDSGAGNGPFGHGWSLSVPAVTRKTERGLPRYADHEESDVFVLAGAEDLVPRVVGGARDRRVLQWGPDRYRVEGYLPRVEGLYARIERWTRISDDVAHWRITTRDNVTSLYGLTADARIAEPGRPARTFSWLLEWTWDGRGHAVSYGYKAEDLAGVDGDYLGTGGAPYPHEAQRLDGRSPFTGRYLKRIRYGHAAPLPISPGAADMETARPLPSDLDPAGEAHFEVVFDYGEHTEGTPDEDQPWPVRRDPFSSFRAGFEVRTWRLCRRVLVFHRFEELGPDPVRVRSTVLDHDERPFLTRLRSVTVNGHRSGGETVSCPPVSLEYIEREPPAEGGEPYPVRFVDGATLDALPAGLELEGARLVDLDGEGLPGLLVRQAGAWWYRKNLGPDADGRPTFGAVETPGPLPTGSGGMQLVDLDGDGRLDLVSQARPLAGFAERAEEGHWEPFCPFEAWPENDGSGPELRLVDLDGDGHADVLVVRDEAFTWYRSKARQGFEPARTVPWASDEARGPRLVFQGSREAVFLADLSGDGLADLVRVRNGEICYWPNLGYGRFGPRVCMSGAPRFEADATAFDPDRLRLWDLDGSGPADLVYLHAEGATFWFNESGNGWSAPTRLGGLPPVHTFRSVEVADLLGTGTACLVWSSSLPSDALRPLLYVELLPQGKPHLLSKLTNHLGATTTLRYAPSTRFDLEDRLAGRPWATRLPFPVQVLERAQVDDAVSGTRLTRRYAYHHGYFDGPEREFRGFGMVEQWDAESFAALTEAASEDPDDGSRMPPLRTRTWFHLGALRSGDTLEERYRAEYWPAGLAPETAWVLPPDLSATVVPPGLTGTERREAVRALRGRVLRQEVYADDDSERAVHPYQVTQHAYALRLVQARGEQRHAVFDSVETDAVSLHYERDPTDPRIQHRLVLEVDEYGHVTREASVAYARGAVPGRTEEQERPLATLTERDFAHVTGAVQGWRLGAVVEERSYELTGLPGSLLTPAQFDEPFEDLPFEGEATGGLQRRIFARKRVRYRADDLSGPLPWGQIGLLALPDESYALAFTPGLLDLYGPDRLPDPGAVLPGAGYVLLDGDWYLPSGRVWHSPVPPGDGTGFAEDPAYAAAHFYTPCAATDPFGAVSRVQHDPHDLVPLRHEDAVGNLVQVAEVDWQALAPARRVDPNGNETAVALDSLGRVTAMARGGDTLDAPTAAYTHVFGAPSHVHATLRERYGTAGPFQQARVFYDGLGREVQEKAQARPEGGVPRQVASGTVVYDNKGRPVRAYEPFFTDTWEFEPGRLEGVAATTFYDPVGRAVAVAYPDHAWEKVAFGPWEQAAWDRNDTTGEADPRHDADVGALFAAAPASIFLPVWHSVHATGDAAGQAAASKALAHAATPTRTIADPLGRPVRTVQDNGPDGLVETVLRLDIQGNIRAVVDALGRVVQTTTRDPIGRPLHIASPDAGDRWSLPDVAGKVVRSWDSRGHAIERTYDALRRPVGVYVSADGADAVLAEHTLYGDDPAAPGFATAEANNQRGRPVRVRDGAGELQHLAYNLDGNPTRVSRQLATSTSGLLDWSGTVAMEPEVYEATTAFDALGRVVEATTPAEPGRPSSRIVPGYDEGGRLRTGEVYLRGAAAATSYIADVTYDARGQRTRVEHGNGAVTTRTYDGETFRLVLIETARGAEVIQKLRYTYDPAGNVTRIADEVADTVYFANAAVSPQRDFTYDALYRLVEATGREHVGQQAAPTSWDTPPFNAPHPEDGAAMRSYTESYAYDAVGNLLELDHSFGANGWTRLYGYVPGTNRLATTQVGATVETYTHDAHGNLTAMPHLPAMAWDWKDQLQGADKGGGGTVSFTYDAAGQRVRKVWDKGGQIEERIYLGGIEISRTRVGGELRVEWETLHVRDGERREVLVETKTVDTASPSSVGTVLHRFQLDDHLGTACVELDEDAAIISYEEFHPYGSTALHSVRSGEEVPRKRYRYTGMERDEATGLQYHGARYYAPWLGRWAACDPEGLADGPNLYAYVSANPVAFLDHAGTGKVRAVKEIVQVLIEEGLQVGGRAIRNVALAGKDVTTRMLMDRPGFKASDTFIARLKRVDERFPSLEVPFNDAGIPEFSKARHAGTDPVVFDTVDIGAFQGKAAQSSDLDRAWGELAKQNDLTPEEVAALKERYTPHHTLDIDKGTIEFVDKDIHQAYQHTGGAAAAEWHKQVGTLVGALGVALLPSTAEAMERWSDESVASSVADVTAALAIDLVLLLTPLGDVKDAIDAITWLSSDEGMAFMAEVLEEGSAWMRDSSRRAPDGTRIDPDTHEMIWGPGPKW